MRALQGALGRGLQPHLLGLAGAAPGEIEHRGDRHQGAKQGEYYSDGDDPGAVQTDLDA
ncbi:hypothetical protein D9M71_829930 [compost metagenome]